MTDVSRVVEVRGAKEGTGFLIGPRLVLTAWHVLCPDARAPFPSRVAVRILGDYARAGGTNRLKPRSAELLWPRTVATQDYDFALLRIVDEVPDLNVPFVPWSDLQRAEAIDVEVIGFPDFGIFTNFSFEPASPQRERDTVALEGRVHVGSSWKQHRVYNQGFFDVVVRQEDAPAGSHIDWEGISGAAVFAGGILVGVIVRAAEHLPGLHRLHALPIARLFAIDEVLAILRDLRLTLPHPSKLLARGWSGPGFASNLLDRFGVARNAPSEFRAGVESFLTSYLGTSDHKIPFGGRDKMLDRLDRWLCEPEAPHRLLLHAPGGRGKSALVVRWVQHTAQRCQPIFLPISARSATNLPRLFYEALAARLAEILGLEVGLPVADDAVGYYRALSIDWLRRVEARDRPVLLVIDGLDEAAGWHLPPALLPELPPSGLRILVSARERAGDRGAEGWVRQLGWDRGRGSAEIIEVEPLDVAGVAEVLCSVAVHVAEPDTSEITRQIARLSGGDPWIVRLYAEDLCEEDSPKRRLQVEDLASRQPGFGPFFRDWLTDQKEIWQLRDQSLDDASLNVILAILACALGPLSHANLAAIYRCWRGAEFGLSREAIEPINRFVQGDGTSSGYVLTHPKLADFLRDEYFADPVVLTNARAAIQRWGFSILAALDAEAIAPSACPAYLVTYFGQHLVDASAAVEDFMRLVGRGWLSAWYQSEGGYRGFSLDVRRAAEAIEERALDDERRWAWRLRCQLMISSMTNASTEIPGWLIVECVKTGRLTGRHGLYLFEQRGLHDKAEFDPRERELQLENAKSLIALVQAWPQGPDRMDGLGEVLRAIGSIGYEFARTEALIGIAALLPAPMFNDALGAALSITSDEQRAKALAALVSVAPDTLRAQALQRALVAADPGNYLKTIGILAQSLPAELHREAFALALAEVKSTQGTAELASIMVSAAAFLPEVTNEALESLTTVDETLRAELLNALAPHLPESQLKDALEVALQIDDLRSRSTALIKLVPRLSTSSLADAARNARMWEASYERALALSAITPHVDDVQERHSLFTKAVEDADAVQDDRQTFNLLLRLAECAPNESERVALLSRALHVIESIESEYARASALESIAARLPVPLLSKALRLVGKIEATYYQSTLLSEMVRYLPEVFVPEAFDIARSMKDERYCGEALTALAPMLPAVLFLDALEAIRSVVNSGGGQALMILIPRLPYSLLGQAVATAGDLSDDAERHRAMELIVGRVPWQLFEKALRILAKKLKAVTRAWHMPNDAERQIIIERIVCSRARELLGETLAMLAKELDGVTCDPDAAELIRQSSDSLVPLLGVLEDIRPEYVRVDLLIAIVPYLPGSLLHKAFDMIKESRQSEARARCLMAIGPRLLLDADREQAFSEVLQTVGSMDYAYVQVGILEACWPSLPTTLLGEAIEKMEAVSDHVQRARLLEGVSDRLPDDLIPRVWRIAQRIAPPAGRARALAALATRFSDDVERANALEEALKGFMTIGDEAERIQALASLVPHLPEANSLTETVSELLRLANSITDDWSRIRALGHLAPFGLDALRALLHERELTKSDSYAAHVLTECLPNVEQHKLVLAVSEFEDEQERVAVLLALIKSLPEVSRSELLLLGLTVRDEAHLADFVRGAAQYFGPAQIKAAIQNVKRIRSKYQRGRAMEEITSYHRRQSWIIRLLPRSMWIRDAAAVNVKNALRRAATLTDSECERALTDLAPSLPACFASEALQVCASISDDYYRAKALARLVPYLTDSTNTEALKIAAVGASSDDCRIAVPKIAPKLPAPLLGEAFVVAESLRDDQFAFTEAITGLAPYLNDALLRRAIASASELVTFVNLRACALTALASRLPAGQMRTDLLSDALFASESIERTDAKVDALRLLLPHLPEPLKERAACALLQAAGRSPRVSLLEAIPVFMTAVVEFRKDANVLGIYRAVLDVGVCFP